MTKKPALGHDPLGWIKDTKKEQTQPGETAESEKETGDRTGETNLRSSEVPKYRTFKPCTFRVSLEQLDFLAALERGIMTNRTQKDERITKNSIIRVAIEVMRELNIDTQEIPDEEILLERALSKLRTS